MTPQNAASHLGLFFLLIGISSKIRLSILIFRGIRSMYTPDVTQQYVTYILLMPLKIKMESLIVTYGLSMKLFLVSETPLTYAVQLPKEKCREIIISLVSGGAHLDFRTKQGQTAIHKAVLNGNQEALKVDFLLWLTCNCVVSVQRGFLFLLGLTFIYSLVKWAN